MPEPSAASRRRADSKIPLQTSKMEFIFKLFYNFIRCLLFGMDHCILQMWFFFTLSISMHTQTHRENKKRMGLNQCQRHKIDEWCCFGLNPNFCSVLYAGNALSKWLDWEKNVQTRYLLTYCVWFCRRACAWPQVCLLMAWIKCNHSSEWPWPSRPGLLETIGASILCC